MLICGAQAMFDNVPGFIFWPVGLSFLGFYVWLCFFS